MDQQPNQAPNQFQQFQTPNQSYAPAPPHSPEPKKSKRKLWLAAGSVLVVIIIAVGVAVLFSIFNEPANDANETDDQATAVLSGAEQLVTNARVGIREVTVPESGYLTVEGELNEAPVFARPSVLVNNNAYAVFPAAAYGFAVSPTESDAVFAVETSLKNFLVDQSLVQTHLLGDAQTEEAYTRYASAKYVCTIYRLNAGQQEDIETQATVSIGCANIDSYDASASLFAPYAAALRAANGTIDPASQIFDTVVIAENDGIETAEVLVRGYPFGTEGSNVSFTRVNDQAWQFVQ